MGGNTSIEWTDKTWNPVTGCTKVSPGCDHCYAERMTNRFKRQDFSDIIFHPDRIHEPWGWKKPSRIFVCSMSDLFHPKVPFLFILRLFVIMAGAPQHTFQILTKRPGRMAHFANVLLPKYSQGTITWPDNVWAGTSVESAKYLPRLDVLAKVPAKVRFVSAEPLLGPLPTLDRYLINPHSTDWVDGQGHGAVLQWVIVGGESGPGARPMRPDWASSIRDQCQEAGVPFFFKQWGEWVPFTQWPRTDFKPIGVQDANQRLHLWGDDGDDGSDFSMRIGAKAAGALLDGREWKEFPNG